MCNSRDTHTTKNISPKGSKAEHTYLALELIKTRTHCQWTYESVRKVQEDHKKNKYKGNHRNHTRTHIRNKHFGRDTEQNSFGLYLEPEKRN